MSEKNHTFVVLVPLTFEHLSDVHALEGGLKLISFNIDFENGYCKVFARSNHDKIIIETVDDFSFAPFRDKGFKFYNAFVSSFLEKSKYVLQKKNEKKLVAEKFSQRSRSKKS